MLAVNSKFERTWSSLARLTNSDPTKELRRIESLLKQRETEDLCEVPAKAKLLSSYLNIKVDLTNCRDYQEWIDHGEISSISIMFASGYLGNPASYFGHPLIKFNSKESGSYLLDKAINYGALTSKTENPFIYVFKGLFGGYDASFIRANFFYHHHEYTEVELRDVWDYKLNLTPLQKEYFIDILYEMNGLKKEYYFLHDNCAYRIGELIEEVTEVELLPRYFVAHSLPIDLFHALDDRGLVDQPRFIPSRKSKLATLYKKLPIKELKLVRSIIKKDAKNLFKEIEKTTYDDLVLQLLIEYYGLLAIRDYPDEYFYSIKKEILLFVIQRKKKIEQITNFEDSSKKPPHLSEKSKMLRLGITLDPKVRLNLIFRPALYDTLNRSVTKPLGSELEVFKFELRLNESTVELRDLTLLSIASFASNSVDLANLNDVSWKIKLNYLQDKNFCEDCNFFKFSSGLGNTHLVSSTMFYYMMNFSVQEDLDSAGSFLLGPELGVIYDSFRKWSYLFWIRQDFSLRSHRYLTSTFETRYSSAVNRDIRLQINHAKALETSLNYSYYF